MLINTERMAFLAVNSFHKYRELFFSTFKLSACTFGGGFVIIPLMRKKFVEELGWIEEDEMMDLTAIAQSSPGAIAVNASILVGYHVAGFPGAMLTVLGTILPPLIIISIISMFYQAFRDNTIVNMAMAGMLCGETAIAGYRYARFFCCRSLFLCEYHSHYSCLWRDRSSGYMASRKVGDKR